MTTAYPFHDYVSAEPLSRTGLVILLIGMIGCGVAGFSASVFYIASCCIERCCRWKRLIKPAFLSASQSRIDI